jgi:hypothetical protein
MSARFAPGRACASTILSSKTRLRWRARAHFLDAPLLQALIDEGDEQQEGLLAWAASKEPTVLEDKKQGEAVVKLLQGMRTALLKELLHRYLSLQERDSARTEDIHRAALAFQEEFEALLAT